MKRNGNCVLCLAVFACCLSFILCSTAFAEISGLYISEDSRENFLLLNADGTCFVSDEELRGEYTISGDVIIMTLAEEANGLIIDGEVIITPDKMRLVKQPLTVPVEEAQKKLADLGIDFTEDAFRKSVESGDLLAVILFLSAGMDVNVQDNEGETALMISTDKGKPALVQVLLDKGANPNLRSEKSMTALMIAVDDEEFAIARLLLNKGADVNVANKYGETPLMFAAGAYKEQIRTIQMLLEKDDNVNVQDEYGETALMKAAERGHLATVRLLLDKGADVNVQDDEGNTALTKATAEGQTEIANLLGQSGATIDDAQQLAATVKIMRSLGTALGSYLVDFNFYPAAEQSTISAITFKDDPKDGLTDDYYDGPTTDAWGGEFYYSCDGQTYEIKSFGKDGVEGGTGEFDLDIVYKDGQFVAPESVVEMW